MQPLRTAAKQIHIPRITAAGTVGWYAELDPIAPSGPHGDELVLTPRKVAALCRFSKQALNDSNPPSSTWWARAWFAPSRSRPTGRSSPARVRPMTSHSGSSDKSRNVDRTPSFARIVVAAGLIRAAGGTPDVLYINPADLTLLTLEVATDGRPLLIIRRG
jgi:hypothetical protein